MVKTYSTMMPLGTHASSFRLEDVSTNQMINFPDEQHAATVLMFICNHCPFVKYVNEELVRLATDYQKKNIRFIAINSNDVVNYPADSVENMKIVAEEQNYPFPYVFDETQEVARAFQAVCTPDFFIYDGNHRLVYRGQLDDARPGNDQPLNGHSIREVLDSLLNNQPVSIDQKPSMGCNIKWKNND